MIRIRGAALLAGVVLTAMLVVTQAGNASACSCTASTFHDQIAGSTAVFVATPVTRDNLGIDESGPVSSADPMRWTFDVTLVYRGSAASAQDVYSVRDSASCGIEFQIGTRYLVVAHTQDGLLWAGTCSGTQALTNVADADLAGLGVGGPPDPAATPATSITQTPSDSSPASTAEPWVVSAALLVGALLLAGLVRWWLRRRRAAAENGRSGPTGPGGRRRHR